MRMIGHLDSEPTARTFSDYLYVKGIKNEVEPEIDGRWAVWVHGEDELDQARALLRTYLANPNEPSVHQTAAKARELMAESEEQENRARKRYFDRDRLFERGLFAAAPLTAVLITISVVVFLLTSLTEFGSIMRWLLISTLEGTDLPEVRQGQVWRLLTPIFLHSGFLHILFNMLWLRDLGGIVERRVGTIHLLLLVLVIGIASNLAQYFVSGPAFGGMSGVVYGLLGYVWMKGRFDPGSGLFLHPSVVMMMLIWLVLGYVSFLAPLGIRFANTVHTVGLATGIIWGFLEAKYRRPT